MAESAFEPCLPPSSCLPEDIQHVRTSAAWSVAWSVDPLPSLSVNGGGLACCFVGCILPALHCSAAKAGTWQNFIVICLTAQELSQRDRCRRSESHGSVGRGAPPFILRWKVESIDWDWSGEQKELGATWPQSPQWHTVGGVRVWAEMEEGLLGVCHMPGAEFGISDAFIGSLQSLWNLYYYLFPFYKWNCFLYLRQ